VDAESKAHRFVFNSQGATLLTTQTSVVLADYSRISLFFKPVKMAPIKLFPVGAIGLPTLFDMFQLIGDGAYLYLHRRHDAALVAMAWNGFSNLAVPAQYIVVEEFEK